MSKIVWVAVLGLAVIGPGCSIRRLAVNKLVNALTSGCTTFCSDGEPELVKFFVPVCLKLFEDLLSWIAVSWAGAISLAKDNPNLIAELTIVEAMMDRALALDEQFADGAIHSFLISYEMSRSGGTGEPAARSRQHFERAMELSKG